MNLDFTNSNRALIRALDLKDLNFVAQGNSVPALLLFVPGIREGKINVKNEGTADLTVEHCRAQIEIPAGEVKDLTLAPGDLIDPNAPKPEPVVVAHVDIARPQEKGTALGPSVHQLAEDKAKAAKDARAAALAKAQASIANRQAKEGLSSAAVKSDVVQPVRPVPASQPIMSTVQIRKRA